MTTNFSLEQGGGMIKLLKEGEAVPFGYGFVRHRIDFWGTEVAPLPLNYFIRWIGNWQQKSYVPANKREANGYKIVRELQTKAYENGRERGFKEGQQKWFEVVANNLGKDKAADFLRPREERANTKPKRKLAKQPNKVEPKGTNTSISPSTINLPTKGTK